MIKKVKNLVFDLDDTLYPSSKNIEQKFVDKATAYLKEIHSMSDEEVRQSFEIFKDNGSMLKGSQKLGLNVGDFFEYICDVDISSLDYNQLLKEQISSLPHNKIIYTNSTSKHTKDVLNHLKIANHFEEIYTIEDADYNAKPERISFDGFFEKTLIDPEFSAMFEDNLRNLKMAKDLGMMTIFICQKDIKKPEYCDYMFDNINQALELFI